MLYAPGIMTVFFCLSMDVCVSVCVGGGGGREIPVFTMTVKVFGLCNFCLHVPIPRTWAKQYSSQKEVNISQWQYIFYKIKFPKVSTHPTPPPQKKNPLMIPNKIECLLSLFNSCFTLVLLPVCLYRQFIWSQEAICKKTTVPPHSLTEESSLMPHMKLKLNASLHTGNRLTNKIDQHFKLSLTRSLKFISRTLRLNSRDITA